MEVNDETFLELIELLFTEYMSCVQNMTKQNKILNKQLQYKAKYFNNLWNKISKSNSSKLYVWFGTLGVVDDNDYCIIINNYLEFKGSFSHIESYENLYLESIYKDDFLIKDA